MNLDRFTHKAREAVTSCQDILSRFSHAQVLPEHLLLALLEQDDGLAVKILTVLQAKPEPIVEELTRYLAAQPKASALSMKRMK